MSRKNLLPTLSLAAVAVVVLGLGFALGLGASGDERAAPFAPAAAVAAPGGELRSYADVADAAMPGVVNISTDKVVELPTNHPMLDDPIFRRFFGVPEGEQGRERVERSLGSGVIISPDGYILTCAHVVEKASKVRVTLAEEREYEAEIIGQDSATDVALIKITADEPLPMVKLGDSRGLRIGDQVMAIGNPFGVGQTVTLGIVSATSRSIGMMNYEDFIQTDAAINPGNSGGALVNMQGELVGINSAIMSRSGSSAGVGFAIPMHLAENLMHQLKAHGQVKRAWLRVLTAEVDQTMAEALGMKRPRGVLMSEVRPDTPAEKAGLREGDVVLKVDGKNVDSISQLRNTISLAGVGHDCDLLVLRDGKEKTVTVKLAELPNDLGAAATNPEGRTSDKGLDGVTVREITELVRRQLELGDDVQGVVVTDVARTSNAWNRGLRQGDVIVEVGRKAVKGLDDYAELIKKDDDRPVLLKVQRGEQSLMIAVPR
ncbi:DegQ family serine endoprotease [bacterium]|nr:DegQ family serine endoprotease [bacterium]